MTAQTAEKTDCVCELIDPEKWDGQEITWKDKVFVTDHVTSVFHVPLNYGAKMNRNMELIKAAGAQAEQPLVKIT